MYLPVKYHAPTCHIPSPLLQALSLLKQLQLILHRDSLKDDLDSKFMVSPRTSTHPSLLPLTLTLTLTSTPSS